MLKNDEMDCELGAVDSLFTSRGGVNIGFLAKHKWRILCTHGYDLVDVDKRDFHGAVCTTVKMFMELYASEDTYAHRIADSVSDFFLWLQYDRRWGRTPLIMPSISFHHPQDTQIH